MDAQDQPFDISAVLEHALDAAFLTRPNGEILYANPAACRLFGYSADEFRAVGRQGLTDVTDPRLQAAVAERARTGVFAGVIRMRRRDGSLFSAEVASAVFSHTGDDVRTSTFIRDITEREEREAALRAANAKLAAALAEVKRLQGILPICSYCKRVRDDHDYWQQVEAYIAAHSTVQFSHGICPECYEKQLAMLPR